MPDDDYDDYDDATSMTDDEADDAAWGGEESSPIDNSDTSGNLPDDGD